MRKILSVFIIAALAVASFSNLLFILPAGADGGEAPVFMPFSKGGYTVHGGSVNNDGDTMVIEPSDIYTNLQLKDLSPLNQEIVIRLKFDNITAAVNEEFFVLSTRNQSPQYSVYDESKGADYIEGYNALKIKVTESAGKKYGQFVFGIDNSYYTSFAASGNAFEIDSNGNTENLVIKFRTYDGFYEEDGEVYYDPVSGDPYPVVKFVLTVNETVVLSEESWETTFDPGAVTINTRKVKTTVKNSNVNIGVIPADGKTYLPVHKAGWEMNDGKDKAEISEDRMIINKPDGFTNYRMNGASKKDIDVSFKLKFEDIKDAAAPEIDQLFEISVRNQAPSLHLWQKAKYFSLVFAAYEESGKTCVKAFFKISGIPVAEDLFGFVNDIFPVTDGATGEYEIDFSVISFEGDTYFTLLVDGQMEMRSIMAGIDLPEGGVTVNTSKCKTTISNSDPDYKEIPPTGHNVVPTYLSPYRSDYQSMMDPMSLEQGENCVIIKKPADYTNIAVKDIKKKNANIQFGLAIEDADIIESFGVLSLSVRHGDINVPLWQNPDSLTLEFVGQVIDGKTYIKTYFVLRQGGVGELFGIADKVLEVKDGKLQQAKIAYIVETDSKNITTCTLVVNGIEVISAAREDVTLGEGAVALNTYRSQVSIYSVNPNQPPPPDPTYVTDEVVYLARNGVKIIAHNEPEVLKNTKDGLLIDTPESGFNGEVSGIRKKDVQVRFNAKFDKITGDNNGPFFELSLRNQDPKKFLWQKDTYYAFMFCIAYEEDGTPFTKGIITRSKSGSDEMLQIVNGIFPLSGFSSDTLDCAMSAVNTADGVVLQCFIDGNEVMSFVDDKLNLPSGAITINTFNCKTTVSATSSGPGPNGGITSPDTKESFPLTLPVFIASLAVICVLTDVTKVKKIRKNRRGFIE